VTGASEDGARSTSREENARVRKDENRPIRSAWGVVKRAMHPQDLATGIARNPPEDSPSGSPYETWVPVVEVSLAEAGRTHLWSMTCCVRREVRSQAVRERRSRLDLATEQFAHPFDWGVRTRPRRTEARGSILGVESAFGFQRSRKTSCATRQKASWSGGWSLLTERKAHASGCCGEGHGFVARRMHVDSALVGWS